MRKLRIRVKNVPKSTARKRNCYITYARCIVASSFPAGFAIASFLEDRTEIATKDNFIKWTLSTNCLFQRRNNLNLTFKLTTEKSRYRCNDLSIPDKLKLLLQSTGLSIPESWVRALAHTLGATTNTIDVTGHEVKIKITHVFFFWFGYLSCLFLHRKWL